MTIDEHAIKEWDKAIHKRLKNIKLENRLVMKSRVHNEDLCGHIIGDSVSHSWDFLTLPIDAPA
jgi:hypothetical protein